MAVLDGVCPRVLRRHTAVHCGIASPRFRCCWTLDSRGARVTFRRHPEAQDGEQMVNPRFKALRRHARTLLAAAQQAGVQAWSASSKIRRPGRRASCMILLQGEATDLSVGTANQEGTIFNSPTVRRVSKPRCQHFSCHSLPRPAARSQPARREKALSVHL